MKLVSPGSLTGAEKLVFENLKSGLPPNGVCVNVMLGQDPWDIRPLMLIDGTVYLFRFSRPLGQRALTALAAEMQGFAVIPDWQMEIEVRPETDRLLLVRPVYQTTLEDRLAKVDGPTSRQRRQLAAELIELVKTLRMRSLVHGHISPANIVEENGRLILLDPRFGALHHTRDEFLAPEVTQGEDLAPEVDLFGLGSVLSQLLGEDVTHQQGEVLKRLLLPAARQRPALEEVERVFIGSLPNLERHGVRGAKVSKPSEKKKEKAAGEDIPSGGSSRSSSVLGWSVIILTVLALGVGVVRTRYPWVFNDFIRRFDLFVPATDPDTLAAWTSNDNAQMQAVAEAAIRDHDLSAENAIVDDTLSGENRPGVAANLLRVALSELWVNDLSVADRRAALALSVSALYPDGIKSLPPLSTLHPGVILAVAGQSQANNPSKQLAEIPIERLAALPAPVGPLFAQLQAGGSKHLANPEVIALAGIVSGNPPPETLEAYIGSDTTVPVALARISLALPLLSANDGTAAQLLAILRDRGGEIGQTLSWFDIDGLGVWSNVQTSDKLKLILGELPERELKLEQYTDLLTFPIAEVRGRSAAVLKAKVLKNESSALLLVLGGEQNRFSREQTVALVSALGLDVSKRAPYVGVFFKLNPSPDMVLLVLMARSDKDSSDLFNLEAARYLRKNNTYTTTTEMLQLLSHHPEPLARSLAYARLSARDPDQKKILQQRVSEESDPGLLKSVTSKLTVVTDPIAPVVSPSNSPTPAKNS